MDAAGNLYVADKEGSVVRKVTPLGVIETLAGDGVQGYAGDGGPASNATLAIPTAIAVDSSGDVYISENDDNRVRVVTFPLEPATPPTTLSVPVFGTGYVAGGPISGSPSLVRIRMGTNLASCNWRAR